MIVSCSSAVRSMHLGTTPPVDILSYNQLTFFMSSYLFQMIYVKIFWVVFVDCWWTLVVLWILLTLEFTSAVCTTNPAIGSILFDANFVEISDEQCDVHEDMFLFCRLFCLTKRSLDRVLTRHLETRVEMHKCPTLKLEIGPAAVFFYVFVWTSGWAVLFASSVATPKI